MHHQHHSGKNSTLNTTATSADPNNSTARLVNGETLAACRKLYVRQVSLRRKEIDTTVSRLYYGNNVTLRMDELMRPTTSFFSPRSGCSRVVAATEKANGEEEHDHHRDERDEPDWAPPVAGKDSGMSATTPQGAVNSTPSYHHLSHEDQHDERQRQQQHLHDASSGSRRGNRSGAALSARGATAPSKHVVRAAITGGDDLNQSLVSPASVPARLRTLTSAASASSYTPRNNSNNSNNNNNYHGALQTGASSSSVSVSVLSHAPKPMQFGLSGDTDSHYAAWSMRRLERGPRLDLVDHSMPPLSRETLLAPEEMPCLCCRRDGLRWQLHEPLHLLATGGDAGVHRSRSADARSSHVVLGGTLTSYDSIVYNHSTNNDDDNSGPLYFSCRKHFDEVVDIYARAQEEAALHISGPCAYVPQRGGEHHRTLARRFVGDPREADRFVPVPPPLHAGWISEALNQHIEDEAAADPEGKQHAVFHRLTKAIPCVRCQYMQSAAERRLAEHDGVHDGDYCPEHDKSHRADSRICRHHRDGDEQGHHSATEVKPPGTPLDDTPKNRPPWRISTTAASQYRPSCPHHHLHNHHHHHHAARGTSPSNARTTSRGRGTKSPRQQFEAGTTTARANADDQNVEEQEHKQRREQALIDAAAQRVQRRAEAEAFVRDKLSFLAQQARLSSPQRQLTPRGPRSPIAGHKRHRVPRQQSRDDGRGAGDNEFAGHGGRGLILPVSAASDPVTEHNKRQGVNAMSVVQTEEQQRVLADDDAGSARTAAAADAGASAPASVSAVSSPAVATGAGDAPASAASGKRKHGVLASTAPAPPLAARHHSLHAARAAPPTPSAISAPPHNSNNNNNNSNTSSNIRIGNMAPAPPQGYRSFRPQQLSMPHNNIHSTSGSITSGARQQRDEPEPVFASPLWIDNLFGNPHRARALHSRAGGGGDPANKWKRQRQSQQQQAPIPPSSSSANRGAAAATSSGAAESEHLALTADSAKNDDNLNNTTNSGIVIDNNNDKTNSDNNNNNTSDADPDRERYRTEFRFRRDCAALEVQALAAMNVNEQTEAAAFELLAEQHHDEFQAAEGRRREREFALRRQHKAREHLLSDEAAFRREIWSKEAAVRMTPAKSIVQQAETLLRSTVAGAFTSSLAALADRMSDAGKRLAMRSSTNIRPTAAGAAKSLSADITSVVEQSTLTDSTRDERRDLVIAASSPAAVSVPLELPSSTAASSHSFGFSPVAVSGLSSRGATTTNGPQESEDFSLASKRPTSIITDGRMSLDSIAQTHATLVAELCRANPTLSRPHMDGTPLPARQTIFLPPQQAASTALIRADDIQGNNDNNNNNNIPKNTPAVDLLPLRDPDDVASDHATMASEAFSLRSNRSLPPSDTDLRSATNMTTGSEVNLADLTDTLERLTEQGFAAKETAAWVDGEVRRKLAESGDQHGGGRSSPVSIEFDDHSSRLQQAELDGAQQMLLGLAAEETAIPVEQGAAQISARQQSMSTAEIAADNRQRAEQKEAAAGAQAERERQRAAAMAILAAGGASMDAALLQHEQARAAAGAAPRPSVTAGPQGAASTAHVAPGSGDGSNNNGAGGDKRAGPTAADEEELSDPDNSRRAGTAGPSAAQQHPQTSRGPSGADAGARAAAGLGASVVPTGARTALDLDLTPEQPPLDAAADKKREATGLDLTPDASEVDDVKKYNEQVAQNRGALVITPPGDAELADGIDRASAPASSSSATVTTTRQVTVMETKAVRLRRKNRLEKFFGTEDLPSVRDKRYIIASHVAQELQYAPVSRKSNVNNINNHNNNTDDGIEAVEEKPASPKQAPAAAVRFIITSEYFLRVLVVPAVSTGNQQPVRAWKFNGAGKPITSSVIPAHTQMQAYAEDFDFEPALLLDGAFTLSPANRPMLLEGQLNDDVQSLVPVAEADASNFSELDLATLVVEVEQFQEVDEL